MQQRPICAGAAHSVAQRHKSLGVSPFCSEEIDVTQECEICLNYSHIQTIKKALAVWST